MKIDAKYSLLAGAGGAGYALVGIAYQLGRGQALTPMNVMAVCAGLSSIFFLVRLLAKKNPPEAPGSTRENSWRAPAVWGYGILSGLTQYGLLRLTALALDMGPLSPVWCAAALGFVPTTLYATWRFKETLGGRRLMAVMAAIGCVIIPGMMGPGTPVGSTGSPGTIDPLYPCILVLVALANSVQLIAIKHLGIIRPNETRSDMDQHGPLFMFLANASLAAAVIIDVALTNSLPAQLSTLLGVGALAGAGCIAGMSLVSACASGPAALVFTCSGVSGILCAALVSILFFGEAAGVSWFLTVGMSVATILLSAGPPAASTTLIGRKVAIRTESGTLYDVKGRAIRSRVAP